MNSRKRITFISLENHNAIDTLKEYCDLLKSHYRNCFKLIINNCNNKLISYHYLTTINQLEFCYPVCQFISQLIKEIPFSGLYCGIVTSTFLLKILQLNNETSLIDIPRTEIISRLQEVEILVLQILDEEKIEINLNGNRLIRIVKEALMNLSLDQSFANRLAISVVKTSLFALDESSHKLGHIAITVVDGKDFCEVYNGILYKKESLWCPKEDSFPNSPVRILIFTEPLGKDFDSKQLHLVSDEDFIANIAAAKVRIVACQKTISKRLIFLLKRQNIFALERLGEESTVALVQMSGAFPISSQSRIRWSDLIRNTGIISKLKLISVKNEKYLLLEREGTPVVSLFVSHHTFDTTDQVKTMLKECIHSLYLVYKLPFVLPSNFHQIIAAKLSNFGGTDLLLSKMMILFSQAIVDVSRYKGEECENIFLLVRNSIAQAFYAAANVLQVGLFVIKE